MRNPEQIREKLADFKPSARGLLRDEERQLLLEARAQRAHDIGDDKAARRYGHQATEALAAAQAGEGTLSRTPELPHFAGEITIHKVETGAQEVPVIVDSEQTDKLH